METSHFSSAHACLTQFYCEGGRTSSHPSPGWRPSAVCPLLKNSCKKNQQILICRFGHCPVLLSFEEGIVSLSAGAALRNEMQSFRKKLITLKMQSRHFKQLSKSNKCTSCSTEYLFKHFHSEIDKECQFKASGRSSVSVVAKSCSRTDRLTDAAVFG